MCFIKKRAFDEHNDDDDNDSHRRFLDAVYHSTLTNFGLYPFFKMNPCKRRKTRVHPTPAAKNVQNYCFANEKFFI